MIDYAILSIHILGRCILTLAMLYGVFQYRDALSRIERLGMGMIGGSSLMTVFIIADLRKTGTPFDVWSPTILTWGVLIFFAGRIWRIGRHARNNAIAKSQAAAHFANGGVE